ncbi:hypothetical protein FMEAI12_4020079 [Parafrankia sp. Ea1.12]|nr:hypothetical protein FMEAI12_4020079 [Parafrankia sp. Ea1.12]
MAVRRVVVRLPTEPRGEGPDCYRSITGRWLLTPTRFRRSVSLRFVAS